MTAAAPLVEIRDATIGWDGVPLVRGVRLAVRPGEFWAVLGPNGAGKSTFLQTLLGLVPPLAGRVTFDARRLPRARLGVVPQRCDVPATVPTTVREFVSLGVVGTGVTAAERRARLRWALGHTGLAALARHDFATLSGGQRQRTLVARALVRRPALLVLDEPTTHLDDEAARRLIALLRHLHAADGIAIVMVTHDAAVALDVATHVALFRDGRVETGPSAELAARLAEGRRA